MSVIVSAYMDSSVSLTKSNATQKRHNNCESRNRDNMRQTAAFFQSSFDRRTYIVKE